MTPEDMQVITACINQNPECVLDSSFVRVNLAQARVNRMPQDGIKTLNGESPQIIQFAVEHNLAGLKDGQALHRPDLLVRVLQSIGYIYTFASTLKVLSVGPRSEAEILSLVAAGFLPANIRGLDLISYSPFVDLGDMHQMPYKDNSFDVAVLGWVLAYSKDIKKAVSEVVRVTKSGGMVAIGCEYNPATSEELTAGGALLQNDYPRFYHTDDILKHFEAHIETVIFRHDIRPDMKDRVGSIMTVFELKKS